MSRVTITLDEKNLREAVVDYLAREGFIVKPEDVVFSGSFGAEYSGDWIEAVVRKAEPKRYHNPINSSPSPGFD